MSTPRVLLSTLALSFAAASAAFAQDDCAPPEPTVENVGASPDGSAPELPQPFPPQSPEELAYLEELLKSSETRASQIERYRTDFERWVTDPVFGPAETFKTFSRGEIRYQAPDRGLFRVDSTGEWTPPAKRGGRPTYPDMGERGKEQWVYDGKSLFEFNYPQKKLVERELPPDIQGKAIVDLLPLSVFVLGAKSETLKARYWLRVTTTAEAKARNEYWLEAYPKRREDAGSYSKIEIIVDAADLLPSAIKMYERNNVQTIYQFTNRSSNQDADLEEPKLWRSVFDPKTPSGWERIVEPAGQGLPNWPRELTEACAAFFRLLRQPAPVAPGPAAPNES